MRTFLTELRHAARLLRKTPGVSLVAILTLAVGIGANVAIFSVVSGVLLRPLPYHDPDRLMSIWESTPKFPEMSCSWLERASCTCCPLRSMNIVAPTAQRSVRPSTSSQ